MATTHAVYSQIFEHGVMVRLDCTLDVEEGWTVTVHQGFDDPKTIIQTSDPAKASTAYENTIKEMKL